MMDQQSLDRLAWAGAEIPPGLGYADTLYFLMLRALYQFAKYSDMTQEQGRREKGKINEAVKTYYTHQQLAEYQAWKNLATSNSRAEYRKSRNAMRHDPKAIESAIRAADRMVEALDKIPIERTENAEQNNQGDDP